MADNFLERHMHEYEERKAKWIAKKKHIVRRAKTNIEKPENEAL